MFKKPIPIYRPILKKSWEIARQNKFLWLFGLFAALAGNGGVYEILIKSFTRVAEQGNLFSSKINWLFAGDIFILPSLETISEKAPFFAALFWIIFLVFLIILGVLIYLTVASRGALIFNIWKIANKKKTDLGDGWRGGKKFFWPVFGLNFLAKALILALLILITIPVMLFLTGGGVSLGWNLLVYVLSFVLFGGLAIIISFLAIYGSCFVVIKNLPFLESIRASWKLFVKNWLTSIEMALILFLIILAVGAGLILFSILYLIPVVLLLAAFAYLNLTFGFWLIFGLAFLGWLAAILLAGAWLSAFQFSAWTLLFIELNKKKIWSKLLRLVGFNK